MENRINVQDMLRRVFLKNYSITTENIPFAMPIGIDTTFFMSYMLSTQIYYVCSKQIERKNDSWMNELFFPEKIIFQQPVTVFGKIIFDYSLNNLELDVYQNTILTKCEMIKRIFFNEYDCKIIQEQKKIIVRNLFEAKKSMHSFSIVD